MDALPSQVPPEFHQHVASLQKEREDLLQIIELLTRSLHDLKTALRAKPLSASNDYEDAYWYPRSQWRLGVKRIHELETYIDELGLHVPECKGRHGRGGWATLARRHLPARSDAVDEVPFILSYLSRISHGIVCRRKQCLLLYWTTRIYMTLPIL